MDKIEFNYNWNNKLQCKCFTTIRMGGAKYVEGNSIEVWLKNQFLFNAQIVSIKKMKLNEINEFIAGIDTGYSPEECKQIITRMYSKKQIDWNNQVLYFILLKRTEA